jgi:hypothetical protein
VSEPTETQAETADEMYALAVKARLRAAAIAQEFALSSMPAWGQWSGERMVGYHPTEPCGGGEPPDVWRDYEATLRECLETVRWAAKFARSLQ